MRDNYYLIAGIIYVATTEKIAAKLCAIKDMEGNGTQWKVLKKGVIASIRQYART